MMWATNETDIDFILKVPTFRGQGNQKRILFLSFTTFFTLDMSPNLSYFYPSFPHNHHSTCQTTAKSLIYLYIFSTVL
jgi:hypothetical protein